MKFSKNIEFWEGIESAGCLDCFRTFLHTVKWTYFYWSSNLYWPHESSYIWGVVDLWSEHLNMYIEKILGNSYTCSTDQSNSMECLNYLFTYAEAAKLFGPYIPTIKDWNNLRYRSADCVYSIQKNSVYVYTDERHALKKRSDSSNETNSNIELLPAGIINRDKLVLPVDVNIEFSCNVDMPESTVGISCLDFPPFLYYKPWLTDKRDRVIDIFPDKFVEGKLVHPGLKCYLALRIPEEDFGLVFPK